MENLNVDWDFWMFLWGDYLGKEPGVYDGFYDEIAMLSVSEENLKKSKSIPLDFCRQAFLLWNGRLTISSGIINPLARAGDARSTFGDWKTFVKSGQKWTYGTSCFPLHMSMLICRWDGLEYRMERMKKARYETYMAGKALLEQDKERERAMLMASSMGAMQNPYMLSALYQAGTGSSINVPIQGPMGARMVNSMIRGGLEPPSSGPCGLRAS
jgi:hypothetical protein